MPIEKIPAPDTAKKAGIVVVVILAVVIIAIFVGFNLYHADTQRDLQAGKIDPREAPKSPTDLQAPRLPQN